MITLLKDDCLILLSVLIDRRFVVFIWWGKESVGNFELCFSFCWYKIWVVTKDFLEWYIIKII